MFVTERFVFLHIPKTGGTFIHKVLRDLHCPSWLGQRIHSVERRSKVRIPFFPYRYREFEKHWIRRKVPAPFQSLPCVLAFRHPLDYYVSAFKFGWWRDFPDRWFVDPFALQEKLGPLEAWSFADWMNATLEQSKWAMAGKKSKTVLGGRSAECLRYLLKDVAPIEALQSRTEIVQAVRELSSDVHILNMETLNSDLHAFLMSMKFPSNQIDSILSMGKVYPGSRKRPEGDSWKKYYSTDLAEKVAEHEWLLLALNPSYQIT